MNSLLDRVIVLGWLHFLQGSAYTHHSLNPEARDIPIPGLKCHPSDCNYLLQRSDGRFKNWILYYFPRPQTMSIVHTFRRDLQLHEKQNGHRC